MLLLFSKLFRLPKFLRIRPITFPSLPDISPVTNHQSPVTNSFRIRRSPKCGSNPCRIRTSKFAGLKVVYNPHFQKNCGDSGVMVNQTSDEGCLFRATIGSRGISLESDADILVCSFDHATMALYTVAPCDRDNVSVSANLWFIFNCHRDVPGARYFPMRTRVPNSDK